MSPDSVKESEMNTDTKTSGYKQGSEKQQETVTKQSKKVDKKKEVSGKKQKVNKKSKSPEKP